MFRQFWDDEKIFKMFLSISPLYVHFNPSENASPISLPNGFDDGIKMKGQLLQNVSNKKTLVEYSLKSRVFLFI